MNKNRWFLLFLFICTIIGSLYGEKEWVNYLYLVFIFCGLFLISHYSDEISFSEIVGIKTLEGMLGSKKDDKTHSSFLIWLIALYIGLFGLASQRFENNLDRIELRSTIFNTYIAGGHSRIGLQMIPNLQKEEIPIKPSFHLPLKTIRSFFFERIKDEETIQKTKDSIIEVIKDNRLALEDVDLQEADLSGLNISGPNANFLSLKRTNLKSVKFNGATLKNIDFSHSIINENIDFTDAKLLNVRLVNLEFINNQAGLIKFGKLLCQSKSIKTDCNKINKKLMIYLKENCDSVFSCEEKHNSTNAADAKSRAAD